MHATVGLMESFCVRWTKFLHLGESSVLDTRTWTLYFATLEYLDYMHYYMMLPEDYDHLLAKHLASVTSLDEDQPHLCMIT